MVASPVVVLVVAAAASVMHVASIAVAHSIVRAPHITYSCQLPQPQQQYLRVRGSHVAKHCSARNGFSFKASAVRVCPKQQTKGLLAAGGTKSVEAFNHTNTFASSSWLGVMEAAVVSGVSKLCGRVWHNVQGGQAQVQDAWRPCVESN